MTILCGRSWEFARFRRVVPFLALAAVWAGGCGSNDKNPLDSQRSTLKADRAANVRADGEDRSILEVRALDSSGNPVSGVRVVLSATGSGNGLVQPAAATDADGFARGAITSIVAEAKTITATAGGVPLAASVTVEFVERGSPPAKLAFVALPARFVAGEPTASPVRVAVQDGAGETIGTDEREVTIALGSSDAELMGTLTVKAVNGVASFDDLTISRPGGFVLHADAVGATGATAEISVSARPAAKLEIVGLAAAATAGVAEGFTVVALDDSGAEALDYTGTIKFASSDPQALLPAEYTFTAGDRGRHAFPGGLTLKTSGLQTFAAADKADGALSAGSEVVVADAPAAKFVFGGLQHPVAAGTPTSLGLTVVDSFGNPARNYAGSVHFVTDAPEATLPADYTFVASDEAMHAFLQAFVFRRAGAWKVSASDVRAAFGGEMNLEVTPGAPASFEFAVQPSNVRVRKAIAPPVQIRVVDQWGNGVGDATSRVVVSVVPPASAAGAMLSGTVAADPSAGIATFADLSLDLDGQGFALRADAVGLTPKYSASFDVIDDVPPSTPTLTVTATTATSVTLVWTAPGDDGDLGRASAYELRVSGDANMANARLVPTDPPRQAGSAETAIVSGLNASTPYYFELKTVDNAGNSSVARASATTAPCAVGEAGATCEACAPGYHRDGALCVDSCDPNPCNAPPASTCAGDQLTTYPAQGACAIAATAPYFTCDYAPAIHSCAASGERCQNGACVADPCLGVICPPPAASCGADGVTLTTYTSTCDAIGPGAHSCSDIAQLTDCSASGKVCSQGACVSQSVAPAAGDLLVSEVMANPTGGTDARRWFEIKNVSRKVLNLAGLHVEEVGSAKFFDVPATPISLAAGSYYVFGGSTSPSANGGAAVDFAWPSSFALPATGHLVIKSGTTVVEDFTWTSAFPGSTGKAMALSSRVMAAGANQRSWYWCDATAAMSSGDRGTPGGDNGDCGLAAPSAPIDWCATQRPTNIASVEAAVATDVYGQFSEPGVTDRNPSGNDDYPFVFGQLGFGSGQDASAWAWVDGHFNPGFAAAGDRDEMMAALLFSVPGNYHYGWRFRLLDPASGIYSAWTYCDRSQAVTADPPVSTDFATATVIPGPSDVSGQIRTLRAAADGSASLPVAAARVTYVRGAMGGDDAGFFVQAQPAGPALFVAVDPASLAPVPAAGDLVAFTVTRKSTVSGIVQADAITGWSKLGAPGLAGFVQDLSGAGDVVSALDSYDCELMRISGTLVGAWSGGGTGFQKIQLQTAGINPAVSGLQLRVPTTLRDALELGAGCTATVANTPLWRFTTTAEPTAWLDTELTASCPAPKVMSASASAPTQVVVVFDRNIKPGSVLASASQFAFDSGLTATAAEVSGKSVTLTTSAQTGGQTYSVTVASTVTDLLGTGVAAANNRAAFSGFALMPAKLVINEICTQGPGGANDEFIELFNATSAPIALDNYTLWYAAATNAGSPSLKFTFPNGATIGARKYLLVGKQGGYVAAAGEPAADHLYSAFAMAANAGQVWLTKGTTAPTGLGDANLVDMVGYGTTAVTFRGSAAAAPPASPGSIERSAPGRDTENNGADFVMRTKRTPKNGAADPEP